ncbi:MAG: type VI secretion system contractile sheath small subunit [Xylophilus ampelinus]
MSKKSGIQARLGKVRPPRVHLTYDVEVGDAIEQKELPFVVGVLGNFSGQAVAGKALPKIKDRKFVSVDLDNFDDVLAGMDPHASYRVRNRLTPEGGELPVELNFRSMADFRPEAVVQKIEPLRKLLEVRARLSDLRNKLAGNEKLDDLLSEVLSSTEKLSRLRAESKE